VILKAPGILTFLISILLALGTLYARYFSTNVPFLTGDATQFYALLGAYVILHHAGVVKGNGAARLR
jgi:hypothetical protein